MAWGTPLVVSPAVPSWPYGSQHQLRRWIVERPGDVNRELTSRNEELASWARRIEWLWPTAESGVEERDEAWQFIGLDGDSPVQAGWWPKGGAVWDAGARVHGPDGQIGGLLVEAKGREGELTAGGCKATSEDSIKTIRDALADVKNDLGVAPNAEWMGSSPSCPRWSRPAAGRRPVGRHDSTRLSRHARP